MYGKEAIAIALERLSSARSYQVWKKEILLLDEEGRSLFFQN
jgi:hypothetical protein